MKIKPNVLKRVKQRLASFLDVGVSRVRFNEATYKEIGDKFGPIDLTLINIGAYNFYPMSSKREQYICRSFRTRPPCTWRCPAL